MCVCGSQNKQLHLPYKLLTDWFHKNEVESVYSAVGTDSFYKADYVWSFNSCGGKCLQRGTDSFLYKADYVWPLSSRGGKCLERGTD